MASNALKLGGYSCNFVSEPPDSYICKICTFVAKDPQQMDCCGKVYCRLCLTEHKKHSNKCPQCSKEGNSFSDKRVDQDIKALKVTCESLDNGCQWVGELRSLEEHVQHCDYPLLPCTNECKIHNVTVIYKCPRRQYQCPHCTEIHLFTMSEYEERTTVHTETCPKVKVLCPNDQCPVSSFRCDIAVHRSTCEYEKVSCKYAELSCEERPLRTYLKKHEDNHELHFQITTESVLKHRQQLQQLNFELLQLKQENTKLKEIRHTKSNGKFTFKVTSFTRMRRDSVDFYSTPFYTSHNGYKLCINIEANGNGVGKGTHVSVYACLMKGDNDDSLTWPFTGSVMTELLNQLEDRNHYTRMYLFPYANAVSKRVTNGSTGICFGYRKYISHSDLDYNVFYKCQYLVNDTLFFRVSVDVPKYKPWLECTRTD